MTAILHPLPRRPYGVAAARPCSVDDPATKAALRVVSAGIATWPSEDATAWALVTDEGSEMSGALSAHDPLAATLAALRAAIDLSKRPDVLRVDLYCGDQSLVAAAGDFTHAWPSLEVQPWHERRPDGRLVRAAHQAARRVVDPTALPVPSRPDVGEASSAVAEYRRAPLLAATDGSRGRSGPAAYGWVTDEGRFGHGTVSGPIVIAEIAGIHALLCGTPTGRPLRIQVDSRAAIAIVRRLQTGEPPSAQRVPPHRRYWSLLRGTQEALAARTVYLQWVPAHSGVLLNEVADRLAVQSRRHHECGTHPAVRDGVMRRIVDEALAARTAAAGRPSAPGGPAGVTGAA